MLLELTEEPSEKVQAHFFKVCTIGVVNHRKLYDKYKNKFYEALAAKIMSLSRHKAHFPLWLRKFVRRTFQETLKIPDAAIFGGESPEESLKDAIQFWREWLNKDQLWSKQVCAQVYDELMLKIIEDIKQVNLSYRVVTNSSSAIAEQQEEVKSQQLDVEAMQDGSGNIICFEANNDNHQQYLKRLADFLEVFVP